MLYAGVYSIAFMELFSLKTFDPGANFATIEYDDYQLEIDTALLDPFSFPIGAMIEFIGELQSNEVRKNNTYIVWRC